MTHALVESNLQRVEAEVAYVTKGVATPLYLREGGAHLGNGGFASRGPRSSVRGRERARLPTVGTISRSVSPC